MENQSGDPVSEKKTLQTLTLSSSDGEEFVVSVSTAVLSTTIKNVVEDSCPEDVIPMLNVDSSTLAKILTYLSMHAGEGVSKEEKAKFDDEFLSGMEIGVLFDVVWAANYLGIGDLLEQTCQKIADIMKNKSVKWVRKTFGVENDFTPQEERRLMKENAWAFEGAESDDD